MARPLRTLLLALAAASLGACEDPAQTIDGPPPNFRRDVFAQDAASKIDVLWIIDNSASMQPHQDRLAASLTRFMELFSRGLVDYRIAVTTTDVFEDQGEFLGNPPVITPQVADPVAAFQRSVKVGTGGKGHEEAFAAARLAIERERAAADQALVQQATCSATCTTDRCRDDCAARHTPRFMRPGAHLYLVFVSDEEEQSFGEIRYYQRYFEGALGAGNEDAVSVSTICGDVPTPPCKARPGARYVELAGATGGLTGSICDDSFDRHLEQLALDAVGLKRKFRLGLWPDESTLTVEIRYRCDTRREQLASCQSLTDGCAGLPGSELGLSCVPPQSETEGWSWEPATNSILFNGASVPGLRSLVVVSYELDPAGAR